MTDFRALCTELVNKLHDYATANPHHDTDDLVTRARAALSQPVSDEELLQIAAKTIEPYEDCGIGIDEYEAETECAVEAYGSELIAFARTAIAADRAQRQPVPPEHGEVQELVSTLMFEADAENPPTDLQWATREQLRRAADLLAQQYPQPVPVSEGLPGPDDCDAEGRCWWFCFECPGEHYYWILAKKVYCAPTYWRPAHALPLPGEVVKEPPDNRDPECVANWPECWSGGYDPRCCRFPKSCSCERGPALPGEVES